MKWNREIMHRPRIEDRQIHLYHGIQVGRYCPSVRKPGTLKNGW